MPGTPRPARAPRSLGALAFGLLLKLVSGCLGATPDVVAAPPSPRPFLFTTEAATRDGSFGMVMLCPAHRHGSREEAEHALRALLAARSDAAPATIWVCREQQVDTLAHFAPRVERAIVNPCVARRLLRPAPAAAAWPGADHPVLNRLRALRAAAGAVDLLACIDVRGEPQVFKSRALDFEELRWLACAAIGGRAQGIVWRRELGSPSTRRRLRALEEQVATHAADLGAAVPWPGARGPDDVFVTALRAPRKLFVIVLPAAWLRPYAKGLDVALPLTLQADVAALDVPVPRAMVPASVGTLAGADLSVERAADRWRIRCRVRGGGDIIVIELAPASAGAGSRREETGP